MWVVGEGENKELYTKICLLVRACDIGKMKDFKIRTH